MDPQFVLRHHYSSRNLRTSIRSSYERLRVARHGKALASVALEYKPQYQDCPEFRSTFDSTARETISTDVGLGTDKTEDMNDTRDSWTRKLRLSRVSTPIDKLVSEQINSSKGNRIACFKEQSVVPNTRVGEEMVTRRREMEEKEGGMMEIYDTKKMRALALLSRSSLGSPKSPMSRLGQSSFLAQTPNTASGPTAGMIGGTNQSAQEGGEKLSRKSGIGSVGGGHSRNTALSQVTLDVNDRIERSVLWSRSFRCIDKATQQFVKQHIQSRRESTDNNRIAGSPLAAVLDDEGEVDEKNLRPAFIHSDDLEVPPHCHSKWYSHARSRGFPLAADWVRAAPGRAAAHRARTADSQPCRGGTCLSKKLLENGIMSSIIDEHSYVLSAFGRKKFELSSPPDLMKVATTLADSVTIATAVDLPFMA